MSDENSLDMLKTTPIVELDLGEVKLYSAPAKFVALMRT